MKILIAESNPALGSVWAAHLERQGAAVSLLVCADSATESLTRTNFDLIILNLSLGEAEALCVADYAAFRHPKAKVIFVTASTFFTDGSIFAHCPNACACLSENTSPKDLAALVEYHLSKVA